MTRAEACRRVQTMATKEGPATSDSSRQIQTYYCSAPIHYLGLLKDTVYGLTNMHLESSNLPIYATSLTAASLSAILEWDEVDGPKFRLVEHLQTLSRLQVIRSLHSVLV